jgi:C2 domain
MADNQPPNGSPLPSWQERVSATDMTFAAVKLPQVRGIDRTGTAAHDNLITAAREHPPSAMPPPTGGSAAQPYVPPPPPPGPPPPLYSAHPPVPSGGYPPPPQQQQIYAGMESGCSLNHQVSYGVTGNYGSTYRQQIYTGQGSGESLQQQQVYASAGSRGSLQQRQSHGSSVPYEQSYGGAGFGPPQQSYLRNASAEYGVPPSVPPSLHQQHDGPRGNLTSQPVLTTRLSNSTVTGSRGSVCVGSGLVRISMELHGTGLAKMDWFSLSDPYVIISRLDGADPHEVHKTECIKKNLNPKWAPFFFVYNAMAGEQKSDARFEFRVMDRDQFTSDDEIGTAVATLEELERESRLALYHSKKRDKKNPKRMGELVVVKCIVDHLYTQTGSPGM